MKCKKITNLLAAYAENQVSFEQRQLVERHLDHCIDCRAALLDYRTLSERLKSLRSTADIPDMAVINISDKKHLIKDKSFNRVRYALAAIPIIVIVIVLAVLQPWVSSSGPQAVLAQAIKAIEDVQSYRSFHTPGVIWPGTDFEHNSVFEEFVFPDKVHLIFTVNGKASEYIFIGKLEYYLSDNTFNWFLDSTPSFVPSQQDALEELKSITDLEQLPDEVIDGIDCYHYRGKDIRNSAFIIEIWIGKDDFLIRQEISQAKLAEYQIYNSFAKYYDFNKLITLAAPLNEAGYLLPGWQVKEIW